MNNHDSKKGMYHLLPVVHRTRDAEKEDVLLGLFRVIQQQATAIENNIQQGYQDSFIETCQPWVVPYLGDLVGIARPAADTLPDEEFSARERARQRLLFPRGEVARAIDHYRRKGTLAVLEDLANDVAKWPAQAVECHRGIATTISVGDSGEHSCRQTLANFRDTDAMQSLCSPLDGGMRLPRIGDAVDSSNDAATLGKTVVGVWRLKSYSLTNTDAKCLCRTGEIAIYSFNPLGHATQLYIEPEKETERASIASEHNLPGKLRLGAFKDSEDPVQANSQYYGRDKSLSVYFQKSNNKAQYIPRKRVVPFDLTAFRSEADGKHKVCTEVDRNANARILSKQFPRRSPETKSRLIRSTD